MNWKLFLKFMEDIDFTEMAEVFKPIVDETTYEQYRKTMFEIVDVHRDNPSRWVAFFRTLDKEIFEKFLIEYEFQDETIYVDVYSGNKKIISRLPANKYETLLKLMKQPNNLTAQHCIM